MKRIVSLFVSLFTAVLISGCPGDEHYEYPMKIKADPAVINAGIESLGGDKMSVVSVEMNYTEGDDDTEITWSVDAHQTASFTIDEKSDTGYPKLTLYSGVKNETIRVTAVFSTTTGAYRRTVDVDVINSPTIASFEYYDQGNSDIVLFEATPGSFWDGSYPDTYEWDFNSDGIYEVTTSLSSCENSFGGSKTNYPVRLRVSNLSNSAQSIKQNITIE